MFTEIALVVVFAAALGIISTWLKQPALLGYIIAGFLLTASGKITESSSSIIEVLASVGIAFLLFLVGMEMNFDKVKHLGKHIITLSFLQTAITLGLGMVILSTLGFGITKSILLSLIFSFSSTIIAVKFLTERRDISSVYGKLIVGLMLVEDLMAIVALVGFNSFSGGTMTLSGLPTLLFIMLKGALFFVFMILISEFMPKVLKVVGTKSETIFLFSIAWGIGIAALVSSKWIGMGIEAGGFLAGLAFAKSAEHYEISSKIRWLRDFFIVLFFVLLGSRMIIEGNVLSILPTALAISLFVLIVTPVVTAVILARMGYDPKTSVFAGLMTGQVSEFGMVLASKGMSSGMLDKNDVGLVTLVGIITIVMSSFFITHSEALYKILKGPVKLITKYKPLERIAGTDRLTNHIIIIGAHRLGQGITRELLADDEKVVVIDYDKKMLQRVEVMGAAIINGDGSDADVLEVANISKAKLLIVTVPLAEDNAVIFSEAQALNPRIKIILTANSEWEGKELYELGADYVIMPHFLSGEHLGGILKNNNWRNRIKELKKINLKHLE